MVRTPHKKNKERRCSIETIKGVGSANLLKKLQIFVSPGCRGEEAGEVEGFPQETLKFERVK